MANSLIIIPTFNEAENVQDIIRSALKQSDSYHVLIVDDASPDGTATLVKELMPQYEGRIHLLERSGKAGLGKAYLAGFTWGLKQGDYELMFEMDADFSHNPEDLPRLEKACRAGAGLSVGSRYVKGGKVQDWPLTRILMSYGASLYVRAILGMEVKDPTAGFKCYQRRVLENIDFERITYVGYAFQIAMKYSTLLAGYKVTEVPITFKDREKGTSKMSTAIFKEAVVGVWKMRSLKHLATAA